MSPRNWSSPHKTSNSKSAKVGHSKSIPPPAKNEEREDDEDENPYSAVTSEDVGPAFVHLNICTYTPENYYVRPESRYPHELLYQTKVNWPSYAIWTLAHRVECAL